MMSMHGSAQMSAYWLVMSQTIIIKLMCYVVELERHDLEIGLNVQITKIYGVTPPPGPPSCSIKY